jgi:hypothetical protein
MSKFEDVLLLFQTDVIIIFPSTQRLALLPRVAPGWLLSPCQAERQKVKKMKRRKGKWMKVKRRDMLSSPFQADCL